MLFSRSLNIEGEGKGRDCGKEKGLAYTSDERRPCSEGKGDRAEKADEDNLHRWGSHPHSTLSVEKVGRFQEDPGINL